MVVYARAWYNVKKVMIILFNKTCGLSLKTRQSHPRIFLQPLHASVPFLARARMLVGRFSLGVPQIRRRTFTSTRYRCWLSRSAGFSPRRTSCKLSRVQLFRCISRRIVSRSSCICTCCIIVCLFASIIRSRSTRRIGICIRITVRIALGLLAILAWLSFCSFSGWLWE